MPKLFNFTPIDKVCILVVKAKNSSLKVLPPPLWILLKTLRTFMFGFFKLLQDKAIGWYDKKFSLYIYRDRGREREREREKYL